MDKKLNHTRSCNDLNPTMDKILMEFTVLWVGWECDSKAWVMKRPDGTCYLCMTNHGRKYEAKNDELHERIAVYENVLKKLVRHCCY